MRFKTFFLLFSASLIVLSSCKKDDEDSGIKLDEQIETALKAISGNVGKDHFTMPLSIELSKIPQDPKNTLTQEKIDLGALLFHETGIALNPKHTENVGNYSCASCHFASAGFQAGRHQGLSDGAIGFGVNGEGRLPNPLYDLSEVDAQPVKTPASLNIAYQEATLWNGQFGAVGVNAGTQANWTPGTPIETNELGYHGTETQAIAAIGVHRLEMDEGTCEDLGYGGMFDAAFPDVPQAERYDRERAGLAIAAYERSLLPNQAPFQRWLRGISNAMTDQEKRGAVLFFGEAECASCHNGPNLANMEFYAIGMKDMFENPQATYGGATADSEANLGRYSFTKNDVDKYKFKVPQIYNLIDSPFYGHGSSFTSVRDVVVYKNNAVKENGTVPDGQLAGGFHPLGLTEGEIDDLTVFIENALRDPNLMRYQPLSVKSGNCVPNNDDQSRVDLGCN